MLSAGTVLWDDSAAAWPSCCRFPWECAPPHSNPGQYHEAALQHTATFTHAMTRDFVHRVHDSAEQVCCKQVCAACRK